METTGALDLTEDVVDFLSCESSYAERPRSVDVIETHISWVFLTGRYAYKLKKPVRFEFLDFSTLELRRRACHAELRLNRRLAPNVYLDVLPVTRNGRGCLAVAGVGPAVDWLVQMRRLPADKALDAILTKNGLSARQAEAIAQHLVQFYMGLPPVLLTADEYCRTLARHIRANEAALVGALPKVHRAIGAQLRYVALESEQFGARVAAGRVVDGHGDLRPEHIFAEDPPTVIDCIEFSDELRRVDIADELAFLEMECRRLGDGGFGERVLAKHQSASGDMIPERLLAFYRAYRACVRAKVAVLRDTQQTYVELPPSSFLAEQHLELANHNAAELGPPALVIVSGLPGTGKSTLAKELAHAFGSDVLSTDNIRRAMLGPSATPADYSEGLYRPEMRDEVYDELFRRAGNAIGSGLSVILDGTFHKRQLRRRAFALAKSFGAVPLIVQCQCARQTALMRIEGRARTGQSLSEARADLYDQQAKEFEPPESNDFVQKVETTASMSEQLHAVFQALTHRLFD